MRLVLEFLKTNSLWLLLGLAMLVSFVWLNAMRERLGLKTWQALLLAIVHTALGVLSVRVFAVIEGFGDLSVVGNQSLFGGMAFLPIFYALLAKVTNKQAAEVFDILTVILVTTLIFARANCIIAGCCTGMHIWGGSSLRWPTRELEIAYYIVFLATVGRSVWLGTSGGEAFPKYMISYGVFRFVIEFFRTTTRYYGPFHVAHLWAFIAVALGLCIVMEMSAHSQGRKVRS